MTGRDENYLADPPNPGVPSTRGPAPFELVGAGIVWIFAACALVVLLAAALTGTAVLLRILWRVVS